MARMTTAAMLMAYIDATQRLLRKIEDQKDRNE